MSAGSHSATPSPSLRDAQRTFFAGLLGEGDAAHGVLRPESGLDSAARFSIYQTAYRARLTGVLRSDHPTVASCLGSQFDVLAGAYAQHQPSRIRSLRDFGDGFPDFVGDSSEANAHALMNLARFERSLLDVFDAADANRADERALETLGASGAVLHGLEQHPSVRLFASHWNVVEQWHAHRAQRPQPSWSREETTWLLWRGVDLRTQFRAIGSAEAAFVTHTLRRADLPSICTALAETMRPAHVPSFVAETIRGWFRGGLLSGLHTHPAS